MRDQLIYKKILVSNLMRCFFKVGWTSNNHGGGYVRLALVPESKMNDRQAYLKNVLKVVCFGHDQRPGMFRFGDCKHPCNARPGCQYQSGKS